MVRRVSAEDGQSYTTGEQIKALRKAVATLHPELKDVIRSLDIAWESAEALHDEYDKAREALSKLREFVGMASTAPFWIVADTISCLEHHGFSEVCKEGCLHRQQVLPVEVSEEIVDRICAKCFHYASRHVQATQACKSCRCPFFEPWKTHAALQAEEGPRCACSTDPPPLTSHSQKRHEGGVGKCSYVECKCLKFTPETSFVSPEAGLPIPPITK